MKRELHFFAALSLMCGCPLAQAYELATHGRLTYEAYKRSVLKDGEFLNQLGVKNGADPFGNTYYDVSGNTIRERASLPFEEDQRMQRMPVGTEPLSIEGWIMRGAIREDDVLNPANDQPLDDPYNTGSKLADNRVLNHFYDPAHDWPLHVGAVLGKKAPDWAVGAKDVFSQPHAPEPGRRNHFTVFDAREAMYRALTGRNKDGQAIAKTQEERNKYWATTFRALGDVVHLIHTRNEINRRACRGRELGEEETATNDHRGQNRT